ncbi:uncharacterized protein [Ptychodera flava]|uniref:uncharacterized protein n=1 Tax=Ptychodera flava TaxID=63121 RepID=UPI00396A8FFB
MGGRDVHESYEREFSDHDGGIPEVYQPQASAYQWPGQLSDYQSSQNVNMWPTNQFIQGTSSPGFLGSQPPTPAYHHNIEQSPTFSQNPYLIPGHQNYVESSSFISPIGQQPSWSTPEQQISIQGPQNWSAPIQPFPHSNTEFTQSVSMPMYSEPRVEQQPIGTTQFIGKQSKLQGSDWSVQVLGTVDCGTEPGQFNEPYGVVWHGDRLLVCDTNNHRIQILNKNNVVIDIVQFDGQFPQPFKPVSVTISPQGRPIIADAGNQQMIVCNENFDIIQTIPQTAHVDLRSITAIGRFVYGCDWNDYAVLKYNIEDGKVMAKVRGQFGWPHTAVATASNRVLVSDYKKTCHSRVGF